MYLRKMPAPAGLQPVVLVLVASVVCFWGRWLGSCKEALGGTVGSAFFSRIVSAGVAGCDLLNEICNGLLATGFGLCVLFHGFHGRS